MKRLLTLLFTVLVLCSCSNDKIARNADYIAYLKPEHINEAAQKNQKEIQFWNARLNHDTSSYLNKLELGYQYLSLFKLKGAISNLKMGDSLIKSASAKLNNTDPNILFALSQASITQHQFLQAAFYNAEAIEKKGSPYTHALVSFDADMELGKLYDAKKQLNSLKDKSSFDFLIRQSKYLDHRGNLKGAIEVMETAFEKIKNTNKTHLYCWALTNLGDMYGHAGRVEDAYKAYLNVLEKEPAQFYALKGIAWIAYAHDHDTQAAQAIVDFILAQTQAPDLRLMRAAIADYKNDQEAKAADLRAFLATVADSAYGDMYNKYLIGIYTDEMPNYAKALELALREVSHRPTPETFSWLSWAYYKKGETDKAYKLYLQEVKGRTFEPDALFKGASILAAVHKPKEAKALFNECLKSSFELGPIKTKEVKQGLNKLQAG